MNYGIFLLKFFKLAIFLPKIHQICQFHIPAPPCIKSYFFNRCGRAPPNFYPQASGGGLMEGVKMELALAPQEKKEGEVYF